MFSNSLKNILHQLSQQPEWEQYKQYCEVKECWQKIINPKIAQNSRPKSISRQILSVATSSSVWAQELSLQRYSLLKKLNAQLSFTLTDIRFSPASWTELSPTTPSQTKNDIANEQKMSSSLENRLNTTKKVENNQKFDDPKIALKRWLERIKTRAESATQPYLLCPQCGCFTPIAELERWQVCSHCIAKKWSLEYHSRTLNKE